MITQGSYTAVSQENGTQVTQVEFDPENRGDPGRPRVFTRHGLWVCVAHFKSKEPESKRPRICLEEGRAATFGSVWADETKEGRLALPGVKVGPGQQLKEKTHRGIYAGSRASRSTPSHKASSGQLFECQKRN